MKKSTIKLFVLFCLLITSFGSKVNAQWINLGNGGQFYPTSSGTLYSTCPFSTNMYGMYLYYSVAGDEFTDLNGNVTKRMSIPGTHCGVFYWKLGETMTNWMITDKSMDAGKIVLCEVGYFNTAGPSYTGGYAHRDFKPTSVGTYTLTASARLTKTNNSGSNPCKTHISTNRFSLIINVIATPLGTITSNNPNGGCGVSSVVLTRSADVTFGGEDFKYYWQTSANGREETDNSPTKVGVPGQTYYLRAKHTKSYIWGDTVLYHVPLYTIPATPTPIATPTGTCGSYLLSYSAPTGETYFWQKDNTCPGPGLMNESYMLQNPYTLNTFGTQTMYLRAYNGTCWSDCGEITVTTTVPPNPVVSDTYLCGCGFNGNVTLSATPGSGFTTCNWYDALDGNLVHTGTSYSINVSATTTYYVSTKNGICESERIPVTVFIKPCKNCSDSYVPIKGKKYVISAWIKEAESLASSTTYTSGFLTLYFGGANITSSKFKGKGPIIDGWQKIEEEFIIPTGTSEIRVQLNNPMSSEKDIYFDDIRLFPFDGNMVSYVYDPVTLKLVAELDANNYATYYIYDDEGKLSKVNKETKNGVKTVKEGRSSSVIAQ